MSDFFSITLLFAQASEEIGQVFDRRVMLIFPAAILIFLLPALLRRIYPTKLLFVTILASTLFSTLLYVYDDFLYVLITVDAAIALVLLFDGFVTLPIIGQPFRVQREVDRIASLERPHLIRLRIENRARRRFRLLAKDDVP